MRLKYFIGLITLSTLCLLSACGGGGSAGASIDESPDTSTTNTPASAAPETSPGSGVTIQPAEPDYSEVPQDIAQALDSGDASQISVHKLLDEAVRTGEQDFADCVSTLEDIYPDGLTTASMPYLSNHVYSSHRLNYPLHVAAETGAAYSWIGQHSNGTRYVYYGASIFQNSTSTYWGNLGTELKDNTLDVMTWLLRKPSVDALKSNPLRIVALSTRAQHQIEEWLATHSISTTWTVTTDTEALATGDYDLLAGLSGGPLPELPDALNLRKPAMIWSEVFNPGAGIHALGLSWAWWGENTVGNAASTEDQCALSYPGNEILQTFTSLRDDNLDFNYSTEACPVSVYTTQCRAADVRRSDGGDFQSTFLSGMETLQQNLTDIDYEGNSVFELDDNARMTKLAVLVGDKLRPEIMYPLDKIKDTPERFLGAYFADYAAHYARNSVTPADAGDHSENNLTIATKSSETVNLTIHPTTYSEWTSIGVTGKAGQPVTLTRADNNSSAMSVRFNMIRSGSTWVWNEDGYKRPKFVTSHQVALQANQTVTITSPIGGPLYVYWDKQPAHAPPFSIEITGGVKHPMLDEFDTDSVNAFSSNLNSSGFDWVDVKTPFAEVHSLRNKMIDAFDAQDGDRSNGHTAADVQQWANDLNTYLIGSNLGLAGFIGDGLPEISDQVQAFCTSHNLDCDNATLHRKPAVQHIVADNNASCGDLCSGNPFDLNSYVKPLGFGESHEMGHNLQRNRLNFYGSRSSETSNNIFPHHVAYRWIQDNNLDTHPNFRLPDPAKAYSQIQDSIALNAEPSIGHPIWNDSAIYVNADVRLMLYLQLAYIHDEYAYDPLTGADGWDLYTKLYLLERQFTEAAKDDTTWLEHRGRLGFSQYDRPTANTLNGNDFMAIALSWVSSADHRTYLEAWGIFINDNAKAQIESNGYTTTIPLIYWRQPRDRLIRLDLPARTPANALPMDGVATY